VKRRATALDRALVALDRDLGPAQAAVLDTPEALRWTSNSNSKVVGP
jgi:hypothetical protein